MNRALDAFRVSAARIARTPLPTSQPGGDVVDLSAEAIALLEARTQFEANLKVAKAGDQMDQSLMALIAGTVSGSGD